MKKAAEAAVTVSYIIHKNNSALISCVTSEALGSD